LDRRARDLVILARLWHVRDRHESRNARDDFGSDVATTAFPWGNIMRLATAFLALPLFAAVAPAAFGDAPDTLRIRSISYAGSGCPAGTVAENVSPDRQAFTLLFDSYVAEIGPGIPFVQKRKNCQLLIDLDYTSGWSFGIMELDYRGYAAMEPGVNALQKTRTYFQGQSQTMSRETRLIGPSDSDFFIHDVVPATAVVWSPCAVKRALNINSEIRLENSSNPSGQGLITTDSIDGSLTGFVYHLRWRRC
jgi:hypothetical protein